MELKKPHPSRLVGGVETWTGLVPHPRVVDKNLGGISQGQEVAAPTLGPPAQGSSARKISPYNFWLQKLVVIESVEETSGPKQFLKNLQVDLFRLTPCEIQHQGSSLKGTSGIWGGTEVFGTKMRTVGQLSPRYKGRQRPLFLSEPSFQRATESAGGCQSEIPST